jgi:hypothetical protein
MLYTPKIRTAVMAIPMPVEITVDVVDFGRYIGLRFYESEWAHLSESERYKMGAYFELVRRTITSHGVDCTLDPIYDQPGVQSLR